MMCLAVVLVSFCHRGASDARRECQVPKVARKDPKILNKMIRQKMIPNPGEKVFYELQIMQQHQHRANGQCDINSREKGDKRRR